MTATRIRYILSGLKAEIRREKDPRRKGNLAFIAMYWSEQNRTYTYPDWCDTCGIQKPIDDFEVMKGYRLHTCKLCWNRKRYGYRKKKRESVLK
jgi:hypothetical protein